MIETWPSYTHHSSQQPANHQTCSWTIDCQLITDAWLSPAEGRRTAQLSPSQIGNPNNCEQIIDCCFKPLSFEEICYAANADWYILLCIPLSSFQGRSVLSIPCLSLTGSANIQGEVSGILGIEKDDMGWGQCDIRRGWHGGRASVTWGQGSSHDKGQCDMGEGSVC